MSSPESSSAPKRSENRGGLARRWRNFVRKRHWPAPEEVKGDFYRSVTSLDAMHAFYAEFSHSPDTSNDIPASVKGTCYVCDCEVSFDVNASTVRECKNWRETLACPRCSLINRWRGSIHLFEALARPHQADRIYLNEQLSPLYQAISARYPGCVGSEYFCDKVPGSEVETPAGVVRNEDVTRLTFADRSFETVLTFDVLEHVPDYKKALVEFYRVLVAGGQVLISVPFNFTNETTIRAEIDEQGQIRHLMEPSYHGDPLSDEGVLCFYEFGLDLLQELKNAGFQDAFAVCYASRQWGYFENQIMFVGRKRK
jgi:hypothetical protein